MSAHSSSDVTHGAAHGVGAARKKKTKQTLTLRLRYLFFCCALAAPPVLDCRLLRMICMSASAVDCACGREEKGSR